MSENNTEIQDAPKPLVNDQFGKRKYIQNKYSWKKACVAGLVAIVTAFPILMTGTERRQKAVETIKFPGRISAGEELHFPLYDKSIDLTVDRSSKVVVRWKNPKVFSGLSRFDRSELNKILPGTEVRGKLLSGATDGFIKAQITSSGGKTREVLKKGAILIGKGVSTNNRLHIKFSKLIHTDGSVQNVSAVALDESDKTTGLKGSNVNHYGYRLGAAAGLHFLGGISEGMREKQVIGGFPVDTPNLKNAALGGLSQASIELATEEMNKAKAQKPRYTIPFGTPIFILFTGT